MRTNHTAETMPRELREVARQLGEEGYRFVPLILADAADLIESLRGPAPPDEAFFVLVAPLLRVLAKQEPTRRCNGLAAYAERRVKEIRAERRELRTEGER